VMGEDGLCRRHYEPRTVCHASMRALSLLGETVSETVSKTVEISFLVAK
jgi:hypothetical protein